MTTDQERIHREELIARGKAIAESGKYTRPRGELLGILESWDLPVYQGSPQPWIDALLAEARDGETH